MVLGHKPDDKPIQIQGDESKNTTNNPADAKGDNIGVKAHLGNPGPAISDNLANVQQEGSKDARRAKAEALNQ